jgi:hypothetical protein
VVAVDPLASLGFGEIWITLAGEEYLLPDRPAADWLSCLIGNGFREIIPGWMSPEDESRILNLLFDDKISPKEIDDATYDAMSVAAGRDWWWAMKLITYASMDVHHWSRVNGRLILAGLDPRQISLAAWVDAVYAVHIEHMTDQDEYTKFKADIDMPPSPEYLNEEEEAEAFMSMLG